MKNMAYAMCCDCCAMLNVENDAICCNVRCGGVFKIKMWWCNCDVECCAMVVCCGMVRPT